MINPLLWLVLSFLLVSISLTAVLVVLVPAIRELSRAARSVEKLCDTLDRELPPTLESIRLTSIEITSLTDDVNAGVHHAGRVVQQVDQSMSGAREQVKQVQVGTRSLVAGMGAAWQAFTRSEASRRDRPVSSRQQSRRPVSPGVGYPAKDPSMPSPPPAAVHSEPLDGSKAERPISPSAQADKLRSPDLSNVDTQASASSASPETQATDAP